MTLQDFITKWQRANLSERSATQQHFLDPRELPGRPKPAAADPEGRGTPSSAASTRHAVAKGARTDTPVSVHDAFLRSCASNSERILVCGDHFRTP